MSLRELALLELVSKLLISGSEWASNALLGLERLHPFNLLLLAYFFLYALPLPAFISQEVIIDSTLFLLDWHCD